MEIILEAIAQDIKQLLSHLSNHMDIESIMYRVKEFMRIEISSFDGSQNAQIYIPGLQRDVERGLWNNYLIVSA